ncbi:sulfotransferase [Magnetococcus marinus MC-1]|uniref:Sulfotransferase n=1 Tax=Magnetococcus marinus (strain ATCC BAA-1437 / JCM 17883 / MC-1) TaxID=156889 RepID=A0LBY3_MAGMM|nr:tetratricopeptide repeat protein [Magnetococcus marinus]ABK45476.1 sulfotransferase [Magnetococcus marinus MC-1]
MARKKKQKKFPSSQAAAISATEAPQQPTTGDRHTPPAQRYSAAMALHRRGALNEAEAAYKTELLQDPDDAEGHHLLGLLLYQQQRHAEARPHLARVSALRPQSAYHHYHCGLVDMALQDFAAATTCFQKALQYKPDYTDALLNLGVVYQQQGKPQAAEQAWLQAIQVDPSSMGAYINLGLFYQEQQRLPDAKQVLMQGLKHAPNALPLQEKLAQLLTTLGEYPAALPLLEAVAQAKPTDWGAQRALGLAQIQVGAFAAAVPQLERVAQADEGRIATLHGLATALQGCGRVDEAVQVWWRILDNFPTHKDTLFQLSSTLFHQGEKEVAEPLFARMAALHPHSPEAFANWGHCLSEMGRFAEAERACRHALRLNPATLEAGIVLGGRVLRRLHRLEEAVAVCQTHLAYHPNNPRVANNLAMILLNVGKIAEAKQVCLEVLAHDPNYSDTHMNLSVIELVEGDLRAGFKRYQHRYHTKLFVQGMQALAGNTLWEGQDLAGKSLVVLPEQGLGDQLQMVRYLPLFKTRGLRRLEVVCSKPLLALFQQVAGVDAWHTSAEALSMQAFDYYCMDMNLPHGFGTELATIPATVPYLQAEAAIQAAWKSRLDAACDQPLRVGLVWAGNPNHERDQARSIPLARLAPLLAIEGISWVSLQLNASSADRNSPLWSKLVHLESHVSDFAQTAGLLANLDLLIAVDTSVVHLAGAMGCPVWSLIAYSPDWRWLLERQDSPWYPTMTLFRQSRLGDWPGVVRGVVEALGERFKLPLPVRPAAVEPLAQAEPNFKSRCSAVLTDKQQLFFCFGPPKNGTTLLQYLLDQHPEISCPAEHDFSKLKTSLNTGCVEYAAHAARIHSRIGGLSVGGVNPLLSSRGFRFMVETIIQDSARGRSIIGANDNQIIEDMEGYYLDFERPKMIAIFRNPIDMALSSWNHNHLLAEQEKNDAHLEVMRPYGGLAGWADRMVTEFIHHVQQALAFHGRYGDLHVMRYESLVKQKRQVSAGLFDYLGASCSDALLERIEQLTSLQAMREQARRRDFFRSGSVNMGAGALDDGVRQHLLQRAQPWLQQLDALIEGQRATGQGPA